MPTVNDVLHHIAQDFNSFGWEREGKSVDQFIAATKFAISMAITSDVEESEQKFMERFGPGRTFYFRLKDYSQGKQLAADLYKVFNGEQPDMSTYTGEQFEQETKLYLFIHLRFLPQAKA
jgi:hypothetical protein